MKGAIEMSTEMMVGIIAFSILFIVVILFVLGVFKVDAIGIFMRDTCYLILSKLGVLGMPAEKGGICDVFHTG